LTLIWCIYRLRFGPSDPRQFEGQLAPRTNR
jgi:hypothetical protein